jgi:hypothetical protein
MREREVDVAEVARIEVIKKKPSDRWVKKLPLLPSAATGRFCPAS